MATYLITHEVDAWKASSTREEVFGPMGITVRTFADPAGSNHVGLIAEIPDIEAFRAYMETDEAAEAMRHDGVHPETLLVLATA